MPSDYIVFTLPASNPTALTKYKDLRLLSLRTDPECFGSTYERELHFSTETWRERLDATDRVTVVAALTRADHEDEWVGAATIVATNAFQGLIEADVMYALFAMWVNPEHRGKGLGRRLIDMGLEWVRARDGIRGSDGRPEGGVGSVLVLEVFEDNERARSFYRGTGFQEVENTCYTGAERGRVTLMLNL